MSVLQGMIDQAVGVLAAGMMEGTGVPWPGGVVVAGAGVVSEGDWLSLVLLAALFSLAYLSGALMQYGLGRLLGEAALAWLPAGQEEKLKHWLARYGLQAVFWTRPLAIGNYMSIPAGMMRMPLGRFAAYTFFGIWPWALGMVLLGRYFGDQMGALKEQIVPYLLPGALVLMVPALGLAAWKLLRHRASARHEEACSA